MAAAHNPALLTSQCTPLFSSGGNAPRSVPARARTDRHREGALHGEQVEELVEGQLAEGALQQDHVPRRASAHHEHANLPRGTELLKRFFVQSMVLM